jgi:hypothetical protein
MGDGTWSVCCMACRIALYRGPKAGADHAAVNHYCEPVVPSAADAGRPDPPSSVGGAIPDPPWTDAPPTTNPGSHREGARS